MKKGCIIAAAIGVALLALIAVIGFFAFGFALSMTSGVADAGKAFLSQIGSGKITEAYESASATLKSQQTAAEFEETIKKLGLTDYASASWSNRQMENDRGQLEGTVTTRSGGKIPLHLDLIKESGAWKVYSLSAPQSGAAAEKPAEKSAKAVPSDDEAKAIARKTLLAFNQAVKDKSFVAFQEQGSSAFREQLSPEKLLAAFKRFVDQGIDISSIEQVQPVFDPAPAIDSNGVLLLKGSYPTKPHAVFFELKYGFENGDWRVRGINVNLPTMPKKHALRPTPSDEELKAMALKSLMAFNKAVQEKSFAAFHKACSADFREEVSVEKFNEVFKPFMDRSIDISSIEQVQPTFDTPPKVDGNGLLSLNGSYPSKPVVEFQLKYVFEDDIWKLIEINVNLP